MLTVEQRDRVLQIRMSPSLGNIDEADAHLSAFLEQSSGEVDRFAVRIVAREALLNAVVHGSREDPEKIVTFSAELDDSGLSLVVEDAGDGFDWQSRSGGFDSTGYCGRGVPLMHLYAKRVTYNPSGNRVELWCEHQRTGAESDDGSQARRME